MAGVSVLVPYRGDDGGPRDKAWAYVREWYRSQFPGWQVVQGDLPAGSPWVKGDAVQRALTRSDGAICVVADADVLSVGVDQAVRAVQSGAAPWATPHRRVYRLTEAATARVLAGEPLPDIPERTPRRRQPGQRPRVWRAPDFGEIHAAMLGGGLVVLPRALYEQVPMDPRFEGWSAEDFSFGRALSVLAGPPWRSSAPLLHLHHPPQPRLTRAVGSLESRALAQRYRAATTPDAMRALIAEFAGRTPVS